MLLLLPDLAPKSVHISETDEEADLVKLEEKIKAEVCMLRAHGQTSPTPKPKLSCPVHHVLLPAAASYRGLAQELHPYWCAPKEPC